MFELLRAHQLDIMLCMSSICGIIVFFILITRGMPRTRKVALMLTEAGGMLLLVFDRYAYLFRGDESNLGWWMVRISNYLVFALSLFIVFSFNLYLADLLKREGGLEKLPKRLMVVNVLVVIGELLTFLNLFTGFLYTFDETNRYQRAAGYPVSFAIPLIALLILLSTIIQYGKKIRLRMRVPLFIFTIVPLITTFLQIFFYGLSLGNMSIVGAEIVLYVFVLFDMNAAEEAKVEAQSENQAKTAFLANMSHEIRTPINAVLSMNEMIQRECEDETILDYSDGIKTAGNTLLGLVNDILDFSKIEAGKMEIHPVDYDISSLIGDLVNMIRLRADEKGLQLFLDFDESLPKILRGDELRLKQVITNILTNAVKYTRKGWVTFAIEYEKIPEVDDQIILDVSVKDTGIGIKEEELDRIFSEFYRVEEKRNSNIEGTGLGMNITKRLLEMMDSRLEVESTYGDGSTFSFRIRQGVVKWDPLGDFEKSYHNVLAARSSYRKKFTAPDAKMLMVDDYPMNLLAFKNLTKETLVQVDTADDGNAALVMMRKKKYDLIFMDHLMPNKDGIETLRELRKEPENPNYQTRMICLTANAISGAREQYIAAGFDDYLTKPINPDQLESMMIEYLPKELVEIAKEEPQGSDADGKTDGSLGKDERTGQSERIPEALQPLVGQELIDVSLGLKQNGTGEMYRSTLKIYYESLEETARELERFLAEEDFDNYTTKVHALKSGLRLIGAKELGEEAQQLENAGKVREPEYIRTHHVPFLAECRKLKALLTSVCVEEKTSDEEKPVADPTLLKEMYSEIKTAAGERSSEDLEAIFAEMDRYRMPEEHRALYENLKAAADNFESEKILSLIPPE